MGFNSGFKGLIPVEIPKALKTGITRNY